MEQKVPRIFEMDVAGGACTKYASFIANLKITSRDGAFATTVGGSVIPSPTGRYRPVDWNKAKESWEHLKDVEFLDMSTTGKIGILIGVDYMDLHRETEIKCGPTRAGPDARRLPLGWVAGGKVHPGELSEFDETQTIAHIHFNMKKNMEKRSKEILEEETASHTVSYTHLTLPTIYSV